MLGIPFEQLEFAFESRSNDLNLHSNGSNLVRMVRICIQMVQIPFECLEFAFECFETRSNGWNLHSSASNTVQNGGICIKCFESHSNGSNPVWEFPFKWFESRSTWENISRKCLLHNFTVLRNFLGLVHAFVTV